MSSKIRLYIYLALLAVTFLLSLSRLKKHRQELKILSVLLGLTWLSESIAHWAAVRWHNNNFVYHVFAPLQLFIIALYYQQVLPRFRKHNLGWIIGGAGILVAILNALLLQPLTVLNTFFLCFEGLLVIAIALYSFLLLSANKPEIPFFKIPVFWVSLALLFFWCGDFVGLALLNLLDERHLKDALHVVYLWTWTVNIFTYSLLGTVFILPLKTNKND